MPEVFPLVKSESLAAPSLEQIASKTEHLRWEKYFWRLTLFLSKPIGLGRN
jgi:hypothetical protein